CSVLHHDMEFTQNLGQTRIFHKIFLAFFDSICYNVTIRVPAFATGVLDFISSFSFLHLLISLGYAVLPRAAYSMFMHR
ncbi:MAG: hypothetical protein LIO52_04025, partial [Oscillospiraceae bacterium]|nr:hypothetical protein [Oscillospiraceae bacterium]